MECFHLEIVDGRTVILQMVIKVVIDGSPSFPRTTREGQCLLVFLFYITSSNVLSPLIPWGLSERGPRSRRIEPSGW